MLSDEAPPPCRTNPARRARRIKRAVGGSNALTLGPAGSSGSRSQEPLNLAHCDLEHMGEPPPIFRGHGPDAPIEAPNAIAMTDRVEVFSDRPHHVAHGHGIAALIVFASAVNCATGTVGT